MKTSILKNNISQFYILPSIVPTRLIKDIVAVYVTPLLTASVKKIKFAMKKILLTIGVVSFCTLTKAQSLSRESADTARADATINNATVYFGYGAELTHQSKVKIDAGTKIIIISQLSTKVDINSLQISVPEDVALLSQHYSVFYPTVPPIPKSKEVEKLEDSMVLLQKEIGGLITWLQLTMKS